MEFENLEILLEKYFEGNTTLNEELEIKDFFKNNTELPENLIETKAMFEFFRNEKEQQLDLKVFSIGKNRKVKMRKLYYQVFAIAASILILISIFTYTDNSEEQIVYAYINGKPIMNEQVAKMEAKRALLLVSSNFNNGTENLKHLSSFSEAESLVEGIN